MDIAAEVHDRYQGMFEYAPYPLWEGDFSQARIRLDEMLSPGEPLSQSFLHEHPEWVKECLDGVKVTDANRACLALFGAATKPEAQAAILRLIEEASGSFLQGLARCAAGEPDCQQENVPAILSSREFYFDLRFSALSGCEEDLSRVMVAIIDVTNRIRTEMDLFHNRALLAETHRLAHLGNYRFEVPDGEVFWSEEIFAIFERSPDVGPPSVDDYLQLVHPQDRETITSAIGQAVTRQLPFDIEYRIATSRGGEKIVQSIGGPVVEVGRVAWITGTLLDITERRGVEKALRQSEERYRNISELVSDYAYSLSVLPDRTFELEWMTEAFARIMGLSIPQLREQGINQYIVPEDLPAVRAHHQRWLAGEPSACEYRQGTTDGRVVWIRDQGQPVWDETHERVIRVIGAAQDITEKKQADREILRARDFYRSILEEFPAMIWRTHADGTGDYVNDSWIKFTGLNFLDALLEESWIERIHPEDRELAIQISKHAIEERQPFENEYRFLRSDGEHRWTLDIARPVYSIDKEYDGYLGFAFDITDRKRAEAALQESEQRERQKAAELEALMDAVPAVLWVTHTTDGREVSGNRTGLELVGAQPGTNLSRTPPDGQAPFPAKIFIDDQEIDPSDLPLQRAARTGLTLRGFEEKVVLADGRITYLYGNVTPLLEDGRPAGAIAALIDITERKRAEEALHESEERYRALVKAIPDIIFRFDSEGVFLDYHIEDESRLIFPPEAFLGKKVGELFPPQATCEIMEAITAAIESGEVVTLQQEYSLPDGVFYNETRVVARGPDQVIAILREVTERKVAEKALQQSEQKYRSLVNQSNDAIVLADTDNRVIEWNRGAEQIFGLPASDAIGQPLWEIQYRLARPEKRTPALVEHLKQLHRAIATSGAAPGLDSVTESVISRPDGAIRAIQSLAYAIPAEKGFLACSTSRDVTEERWAEEAVRRSEERYRAISEITSDFAYAVRVEQDGRFALQWPEWVSDSFSSITGYSLYEMMERGGTLSIFFPEDLPVAGEWSQRLLAGERSSREFRIITKRGDIRWLHAYGQPVRDETGERVIRILVGAQDITDRKRVELALRESEERYRAISELTSDYSYSLQVRADGSQRIEWITDAFGRIMGLTLEEIRARGGIKPFIYPEDIPAVEQHHLCWLRGQPNTCEYRLVTGSGKVVWIRDQGQPVWDDTHERVIRVIGAAQDITEKKKADEALRETNQMLQAVIRFSPLGISVIDPGGNVTLWSPAAERLFGWKQEEVLGKYLPTVPHGMEGLVQAQIQDEFAGISRTGLENRRQRKDGSQIDVSISTAPLLDVNGSITGSMALYLDVTEHRRAEARLETSYQQLRSLSAHLQTIREDERTLISREIHDELGQAMTGLKMDLFWLKKRVEKGGMLELTQPVEEKIAAMVHLVDQTINSVRRISTELRPSILDTLGLIPAIEWLAKDFQARSSVKFKFTSSLEGIDLPANAATALFRICQESLTNIIRHARATRSWIRLGVEGAQLCLEVEDNGKGITDEALQNMTSLGLLGMKERAHLFGGDVKIERLPTSGTRVLTLIPLPSSQKNSQPLEGGE